MPTPHDNRVLLWFWKGDSIAEKTVDELAQNIKRLAPAVSGIIVKTSNGAQWQGAFDTSKTMRIDGPDKIDMWVQTLNKYSLEFHAWAVPQGLNASAEADKIVQACNRPGVKSMVLDVEPYSGFYQGGRANIRPLMNAVRSAIPGDFHIGMSADSRPQQFKSIFPDEWFPFVQSVHPQVYWLTFQQTPQAALDAAFVTWNGYGRPVFPVLQGNADRNSMIKARNIATDQFKVQGLSWWRLGTIGSSQWPAVNLSISGTTPIPNPPPPAGPGSYGPEIIVTPGNSGYSDGTYSDKDSSTLLKTFTDSQNQLVKYKATNNGASSVWARWDPQLNDSGLYEISVYIPGQHASTTNARYKIHNSDNRQQEIEANIAQVRYFDLWVSLGVYYFNANDPTAGVVFLNDLTGETGKELAFGTVRWRQVLGQQVSHQYLADGFDPPIGTVEERRSEQVWPGKWLDATGYAIRYRMGTPQEAYHTGADLNLNSPYFDADAHSPVVAAASGIVTYAGKIMGWGRVIVIRHDPLVTSGQVIYARYAHIESPRVQLGQRVVRGEPIAQVGNADGTYPYHLHFDVSQTSILDRQPGHWPTLNLSNLLENYVDPRLFVAQHRPISSAKG